MPAVRTAGAGLPHLIGQLVQEPLTQGGSKSIGTTSELDGVGSGGDRRQLAQVGHGWVSFREATRRRRPKRKWMLSCPQ